MSSSRYRYVPIVKEPAVPRFPVQSISTYAPFANAPSKMVTRAPARVSSAYVDPEFSAVLPDDHYSNIYSNIYS